MRRGGIFAAALALAGCAMVGPDYRRPDLALPAAYPEAGEGTAASVPLQWWKLYDDAKLDELVGSGLGRNADVRLAAARVEEAEAALREARAIRLVPEVDAQAGALRGRAAVSGQYATGNTFTLGLATSFEVDVWGRLRRGERSVQDELLASRYGRDTVALTLAATIARTYFAALSLDSQYTASEEILRSAEDSLDLTRKRLEGGVGSNLDVYQAGTLRDVSSAQLKEIARQRAMVQHELGVLTGNLDLVVPAKELHELPVPPLPPPGLPSQLLERRPDVRQAEAQLEAATERIGVARAAQFPTLSLTGSAGLQSAELDSLLHPGSKVWSIGAGLLGPVIDGGRYAARTQQAEAQARQAEAVYQRAVENAFRDVSDALSNIRLGAQEDRELASRLAQARSALRLANLRYESGYSPFLEVLDAQRTLNLAQLEYIRNRQNYLSYTVDLMNALGGGWTE
ncbi:MAG TPA: efflux transporter outer membrane subunit [Usitatibacter sp.]|nr:efflux transporter outer membrane subunit [Usitatibacter sp.]